MATSTITVKTGGEWVKFDTLGYTFENGKEYTLQVLGSAKFGDDGKNGILIDNSEPYTFTKKSGVDLYVLTNDPTGAVVTVSDKITLGLATKGGSGGGTGAVEWGNIGGSLENQTDLAEALSAKQDVLTAGTGIDITNNTISVDGVTTTELSIDTVPTQSSSNLITSGGVYSVLGDIETLLSQI